MRGGIILSIFFLMFTMAALLFPAPMFPGSYLSVYLGNVISGYSQYLGALFNGVFYGVVMWLVFIALSKRLGQEN